MLTTLLFFIPTCVFFAAIPGPDFAVILKTSLINGKRAAICAAFGIACGLFIHTALSVLGLTAIIAHSPTAFNIIRYAGAAYLAYIGLHSILATFKSHKQSKQTIQSEASQIHLTHESRKSFSIGFLTNVLNPKAILFFLTFLPQFVSQESNLGLSTQLLILGLVMSLITGLWFIFLSLLLGKVRKFFENEHFRRWLERVTGIIFLGFGVKLVAEA